MQISAVNRHARARYATFVASMDLVRHALDEVNQLIGKVQKRPAGARWRVATRAELRAMRRRALDELDRMRAKSKKYEAELLSREWRV